MIVEYAANAALGYLLGSLPWGLIVGYLWLGRDIRDSGSGKTGTTNVLRTAGKGPAALVMLLDIAKGAVPALVGRFVFDSNEVAAVGAGAAVVGHVWPVFAGFRGGRGVASTYGGVLGLAPVISIVFPLIGAALIGATRYVSVMSVVGVPLCAAIVVAAAAGGWLDWSYAWYCIFATVLVEYKHLPNIRRLLSGTEPRIGQGGDRPATG
ncbi:MAG: glycerol-3-phosphate 1-O-acyltransferase PlsY [Chloroflexi bacterium]|nr:glycerol-3-phosphate 1-O-acyltransferase PlsY [Chloroflexota bacterium]MCZ7578413.1 glycerol-3-phosphate 1-O-acyltransferase PlsY [Dehalococcoidia bacterium]NJD65783.1 glycerol-3-phosphate 1-O-acyltransferase PlsY [Chloroflexota bacterium]PWB45179.1 MAG: acyl-phosphate glycerol 3-phosphate acyltransferase [Dehalococcoidia bacterium]